MKTLTMIEFDSSQQAVLPLDQGTEFKKALTKRTRDSFDPQRSWEGSQSASGSSILFHHFWISSSQSFQKETRGAYHLDEVTFLLCLHRCGKQTLGHEQQRMELVPIHVTGHELRTIQYWPARIVAQIKRSGHRHHRGTTPHHHHRPDFKPWPLRLCMRSTLSGAHVTLQHWMEKQRRGHASHLWELSQL